MPLHIRVPSTLCLAVILCATIGPRPSQATTVLALTLEEKAKMAPVVVHGMVERIETRFNESGDRINSYISIRVFDGLKGGFVHGDTLLIRRIGGRIGELEERVQGAAEYTPGEEVLLFLEPDGAEYIAIGIGIATYRVQTMRDQKRVSLTARVAEVHRNGANVRIERALPQTDILQLEAFKARVSAVLKGVQP